jgi:hypothetical protein
MIVAADIPMIRRVRSAAALAGGATTVEFNRGIERSSSRITSGGGATIVANCARGCFGKALSLAPGVSDGFGELDLLDEWNG